MAKRDPLEPQSDFYRHHSLEALTAQQGVKSVEDLDVLRQQYTGLWPNDESIEAFLAFVQEVRGKGPLHV